MQITSFGTGLMGTGFVRRLLANGHAVNVWNRSPAKAQALVALGAVAFDDPAAALAGAERAARWAARGHRFVHAPVFMAPSNCAEGTGLMLVSGAQADHDALLPDLQGMTGKVVYMGAAPERAAAFKLFGNLTLLGILSVLGDVNRLVHAVGINTADAFSLFQHFNPGATLPARATRIENALTESALDCAAAARMPV